MTLPSDELRAVVCSVRARTGRLCQSGLRMSAGHSAGGLSRCCPECAYLVAVLRPDLDHATGMRPALTPALVVERLAGVVERQQAGT